MSTSAQTGNRVPSAFLDATAARVTTLNGEWEFCELPSAREFGVADLATLDWRPAAVPGTVAGALRALGELDGERGNALDRRAFVFRRRFRLDRAMHTGRLVFDGLATLADVWLNGEHLLSTRNMFCRYVSDVGERLSDDNELVLHFRALAPELARKRPRGRWTTRLVEQRNLRFVRTTLLGRVPGWTPPHPPVGPWKGIRLIEGRRVELEHVACKAALDGLDGVLSIELRGRADAAHFPTRLEIRVDDRRFVVPVVRTDAARFELAAEARIPAVAAWWPHDLGTPRRYAVSLALHGAGATCELGELHAGFRRIEQCGTMQGADGGFALRINGREVFCRGACWTPVDIVGFGDDPAEIRRSVTLARDAGMNMLRVSGTMVYESDAFYDACDEFGVLVWQDFMFASMDYPEDDPEFAQEVCNEAEQTLARLHHRPCLAVLCGNSEVEQQAAMKGLAPDAGRTPLFSGTLAEAGRRWCPGTPYVTSSPTGGALPFHVDAGVAHYFGVGAYLRDADDARASRVRFASECLAFSNVPEDEALDELFATEARAAHSPSYKRGVPRDSGAAWDFSDVTDHYLEQLFRCNARAVRYADTERYLALARVVPGELMARTLGLWRAEGSLCRGALVWFLRDLRPGSGWGVLDSAGRPKAPYWFLKRACAPRAIWFTDEGLNGLRLHARNDAAESLAARVRVHLIRNDGVAIGAAEIELSLPGAGGRSFCVDALLGRFADSTYAYRFGACENAITQAQLLDADGKVRATAQYLPTGLAHELRDNIGLRAVARPRGDGSHDLHIESRELALFVRISAAGFLPADNYFHVPPGGARDVVLRPSAAASPLRGRIAALNARMDAGIQIGELPS